MPKDQPQNAKPSAAAVRLRPHHLLCIQKFIGRGYDENFTRYMAFLAAGLQAAPETPVILVAGADDLCARCPHLTDGGCDAREKVNALDEAVLSLCGLSYGKRAPWAELSRAARERVLDAPAFERVCAACEWFGLCSKHHHL